jgi:dUTP pyrophosphatase
MTTDVPESKKRKVSPEPDAGIAPASNLLIKRLSEKAKLPTRGSALAAGYDLYR